MEAKSSRVIGCVMEELTAAFEMIDMRSISFYLSLKVSRDHKNKTIKLSQPAYIDKILFKFHLVQANRANTPIKKSPLTLNEREATLAKWEYYQGIIDSIVFSIVKTKPDIAFITSVVSRFAKNLLHQHTEAIITILQYLIMTKDMEIIYGEEQERDLIIKSYFDSDWAGDYSTRKSISRYIFILNGEPVSWYS